MPEILSYADWIEIPHDGTTRAWVDFDLDSVGCPADTIGVMAYYIREDDQSTVGNARCGIRPNGSSDDYIEMRNVNASVTSYFRRHMIICGCDGNKLIETYRSSIADLGTATLKIFGWILAGEAHLLTNTVTATGSISAATWNEVHFDSAITSGTPSAWILRIANGDGSDRDMQPRPAGSSYALKTEVGYFCGQEFIVGSGNNNRVDIYSEIASNYVFAARGYFTDGYTDIHDATVDYEPASTGAWQSVDLSASLPADAVVYTQSQSGATSSLVGVREVGSADDDHPIIGDGPANQLIALDGNSRLEAYVRYASTTCAITGYFTTGPAAVPPAYPDLTFYYGVDIGSIDLSAGWAYFDPDGFSADELPHGLSLSQQGILTGTPSCPPDVIYLAAQSLQSSGSVQSAAVDVTQPIVLAARGLQSVGSVEGCAIGQQAPARYVLQFGGNTYINTDLVPSPTQAYTIELDFYANTSGGNQNMIGCDLYFFVQANPGGVISVSNWDKDSGSDGAAWSNDTWHTVTVYWPGSSGDATSQIDGGAKSNHPRGSTNSNSKGLAIGAYQRDSTLNSMDGKIKNVKIWTGDKANLVAHYPIDDNSNTITDIAGNNDGTLTIGSGSWIQE